MNDYLNYLSPFSWRYGSNEMRQLWGETRKRLIWRQIWVALAQAQSELGLVTPQQVTELAQRAADVDIPRALQIEAEIHHDLMAEVRVFAEQCPTAGGIIHLGCTSMDIEDNAEAIRMQKGLDILLEKLCQLLAIFAEKITTFAAAPSIAFTHLQPAEPTTVGYRLANYAQDLIVDMQELRRVRAQLKGKGFKGAVGTGASYIELLGSEQFPSFEKRMSGLLALPFFPVTTQTYPRKQDFLILSALAGLGGSLYKFAFDLRLLQSPVIGEWGEPFSSKQVGSSAMPFKRNPINAEKIDSLARYLAGLPQVAWQNAAHSLLERTLDDSANRRSILPEAFLIADELLKTSARILSGLTINLPSVERNLANYAPFAGTERLLMALVKAGADRQQMHENLRDHAMRAWQDVQQGLGNPILSQVTQDAELLRWLSEDRIRELLQVDGYTGFAPERALETAREIQNILRTYPKIMEEPHF